jgi:hypothetical protein
MNESDYWAGEISDQDLDNLADAGDYYLDEEGWSFLLTGDQIEKLASNGLLFLSLRGKLG